MVCTRSTRILPGLAQALSWLHQGLPPGEQPTSPILAEATTTAPPRRLPRADRRSRRERRLPTR